MEEDANFKEEVLVKNYIDYEIMPNGFFLPICTLLSLYLFYQKASDNLMASWYLCLTPLNIYFSLKFLYFMYKIAYPDENNAYNIIRLKLKRFENISNLSNFFSLLFYAGYIVLFYFIGLFLDTKKDEYIFSSVYVGFGILTLQIIYSFLRTLPPFSIMKHIISYKKNEDDEEAEKSTYTAFIGTIVAPILTYFSNMMIVCSTSSGMCTQLYMSTITSLLGAFGVSISHFSDYLFPITMILLGVSLVSLWIKRKSFTHKPFLLGSFSAILIFISHYVETLWFLIYIGNVLMILAAVWNMKMNKLSGLPRFK